MEEETAGVQKEQCLLKLHNQVPWWLCGWSSHPGLFPCRGPLSPLPTSNFLPGAKGNLFLLPLGETGWGAAQQHLLRLTSVGLSEESHSVEVESGFSLLGKTTHVG